jgi:hypothetical protein
LEGGDDVAQFVDERCDLLLGHRRGALVRCESGLGPCPLGFGGGDPGGDGGRVAAGVQGGLVAGESAVEFGDFGAQLLVVGGGIGVLAVVEGDDGALAVGLIERGGEPGVEWFDEWVFA